MSEQGAEPERPETRPRIDVTTEHPPAEVVARVRCALRRMFLPEEFLGQALQAEEAES